MALSPELISQFAKLVNKDKKTKVESTVYGTIVEDGDGNKYVKIDGSDQLTPLSNDERPSLDSTTADAKVGERVTVLIKDHTATVTGNVSSPAARTGDVVDIKEAQILLAQQVQADQAYFKQLIADEATLGKLEAAEASITDLIASTADIENLLSEKITVTDLIAGKIDASVVQATYATIESLNATDAKIGTLSADYASFKTLSTEKFAAHDASIGNLQTNSLTAEKADIAYAKIDFSNMIGVKIDEAAIEHLFASSGMVKDITIDNGVITGELIGVTLKGDLVEAGTLKADKLVVKGKDGIYYKLNIEGGAVASAEVTEEELQNGLSGSVIIAKSITAEKVSVSDLVAFGATIGGFQITNNSIHSVTKQTVDATTRGFYVDNDGQLNVGDETNFIKFFRDTDGTYKLRISADSIVLGSSKKNVEDAIEEVADIEIGGTNLLLNSSFKEDLDKWNQAYPTNNNSILNIRETVSGTDIVSADVVSPEQNSATVKLESANLIPYPYASGSITVNGIEWVVNADGTITANGTATGNSIYALHSYNMPLSKGTYTISGIPTNGSFLTFIIQIATRSGFARNNITASGDTFTLDTDVTDLIIQLVVFNGYTANGLTFKPMINEGSTALPYTPYVDVDGAAITVCGKNLLSPLTKGVRINSSTGIATVSTTSASTDYIRIDSTENYYIAGMPNDLYFFVAAYDANKNFLGRTGAGTGYVTPRNIIDLLDMTAEAKQTVRFIRVTVYENSNASGVIANLDNATPFIVKGSDSQTYEPYTATNYFADELGNVTITDPVSPKMTVISDFLGVNMDLSYKLISGFVTKAGKPCLNIKHREFNATKRVYQDVLSKIERDSTYIFSGWFLSDNIVGGTTNHFLKLYIEGHYINDSGAQTWYASSSRGSIPTDTAGKWQRVTFELDASTIPETAYECWLEVYARDMTGDLYFRDLKLEKGNKATDWSPAPEDAELEISKLESSLSTTAEGIVAQVSSSYVSKDEFGTYRESANTKVEQTAQGLRVSIDGLQETINKGEFEQVKVSGKNYVMDANGFTIGSNDENNKLNTTITEDGMTVKNDGSEVLSATSEGVEAKDLHAKTYLIIGNNSRFEDYNGNRTACFWIGS